MFDWGRYISVVEAYIDGVNHHNTEKIHELILQRIKETSEPKAAPGV